MCALLEGRDVLLVSPTGSGKSLSYQVAGVLLEGCTVVVSPLLALQQDQIHGLGNEHPELRAARISSAESDAHRDEVLERARADELEFLFMSPEQLANPDVRAALAEVAPSPGRRRRGALRLHVGPRLPTRLPPARRADRRHRVAPSDRADRHRGTAGARGHRRAAAAARPRARRHRLRPGQHRARGARVVTAREQERDRARAGRRETRRRHRLLPHPARCRGVRRSDRRHRQADGGLPRRAGEEGARSDPRGVPRRRGRRRRRHLRVRDGHRQAGHPLRGARPGARSHRTPTTRRSAGPGATASRRRRSSSTAPRTCRSASSSPAACPTRRTSRPCSRP